MARSVPGQWDHDDRDSRLPPSIPSKAGQSHLRFPSVNGDYQARFGPISPLRNAEVDMIGRPKGSSTADPAGLAAQKRHFMSKNDCPSSKALGRLRNRS